VIQQFSPPVSGLRGPDPKPQVHAILQVALELLQRRAYVDVHGALGVALQQTSQPGRGLSHLPEAPMPIPLCPYRLIHLEGSIRVVDQQDVDVRGSRLVPQESTEEVHLLDDHRQVSLVHLVHDPHQLGIEDSPALVPETEALSTIHMNRNELSIEREIAFQPSLQGTKEST